MMLLLSVLLLSTSRLVLSRPNSLIGGDDMDNEIEPNYTSGELAQPEWIRMPSSASPNIIRSWVGSHVELECEATGSPPPQLQWFKEQTRLTSDIETFETNSIREQLPKALAKVRSRLVINYLLPVHEGRFTCIAKSGSKIESTVTRLIVMRKHGYRVQNYTHLLETKVIAHYMPRISLWSPNYLDVIGSNVILPCRAFGNPKPQISWTFENGKTIGDDMTERVAVLPDGELSIKSLSWEDMGVYTCTATNMVGFDTAETFLYPMRGVNENF